MPSFLRELSDRYAGYRLTGSPVCTQVLILLIFLSAFLLTSLSSLSAAAAEAPPMFTIVSPLTVNGRRAGNISIGIGMGDIHLLEVRETADLLKRFMNVSYVTQFLTVDELPETEQWMKIEDLDTAIAEVAFSRQDLSLSIIIRPEYRGEETIAVRQGAVRARGDILEELPFSFFMNSSLSTSLSVNQDTAAATVFSLPLSVSAKPVINFGNTTAASDFSYRNTYTANTGSWSSSAIPSFKDNFRNTNIIYDFPDDPLLFQAGNISYSTLPNQSAAAGKGVVLKKSLAYQSGISENYFENTSPKIPILLQEDSYVSVIINGNAGRRLFLYAGPYTITSLPLTNGVNTVIIQQETVSGETTEEEYTFGYTSSLLPREETQFTLGIGFADFPLDDWDALMEEIEKPILFMNQERGISYNMKLGYFGEITAGKQAAGLTGTYASRFGTFNADAAVRFTDGLEPGFAGKLDYSYYSSAKKELGTFNLNGSWQTRRFDSLSADVPDASNIGSIGGSYSRSLFQVLGLSLSTSWTFPREASKPVQASFGAGSNFSPAKSVSISGRARFSWDIPSDNGSPDISGSLFLTYRPEKSNISYSAAFTGGTVSLQASWRPEPQKGTESSYQIQTSGIPVEPYISWESVQSIDSAGELLPSNLSFSSQGKNQFGNWSFRQRLAQDTGTLDLSSTEFSVHSALIYADSVFSVSRPVSSGFVLVKPQENFRDIKLLVNPTATGIQTTTEETGTAVVSNISSFRSSNINIQAEELSAGYEIGTDTFTFNPSYSGAAVIRVGSSSEAAPVSLTGRFVKPDWSPLNFASGQVYRRDGEELDSSIYLFTDETGYFEIHGLTAGNYEFRMLQPERRYYRITIPEGTQGQHSLGNLVFGGSVLQADFPPLGSPQQLAGLKRRLDAAQTVSSTAYELSSAERRNINIAALEETEGTAESASTYTASQKTGLGPVSFSGTFADEQGTPVSDAAGRIMSDSASYNAAFAADESGRFTLWGLLPGTYTMHVQAGTEEKQYRVSVPILMYGMQDIGCIQLADTDADGDFSGQMQYTETEKQKTGKEQNRPLIDVSGMFIDTTGMPAVNRNAFLLLYNDMLMTKKIRFAADGNGSFTIPGLRPGSYTMVLQGSLTTAQKEFRMTIPQDTQAGRKDAGVISYKPVKVQTAPDSGTNPNAPVYKVISQEE